MNRRQVFVNAITTSIQVIASAAILFFLYRFLVRSIGMERLGIWSLVLSTTSIVTLAHQGLSTSIIKFVAKYSAREDSDQVSALIQTAIISAAFSVALVAAGLYPVARWILTLVVPHTGVLEAFAILPLALVSLWCNVMQGILQAGLAGHQWIALCNYLELAGAFSYLLLALGFVPGHGLLGLAFAQALQSVAFVLLTWSLLRRRVRNLPLLPRRWDLGIFREIAAYGIHFQFVTAAQAVREPVTKALIAKFGGLAMTGFYDLASRFVVTCRELIVQANQVLVPTVSGIHEREPHTLPAIYRESYRIVFFFAVPVFAALVVLAPLVSHLWIGRYEAVFVEFVAILALAWLVNILANPAYVLDLGTGELRPVSVGCFITGVLNAALGFFAGYFFGGWAVVASSAFALACGYVFILAAHHRQHAIPFSVLLPAESRLLLMCSISCAAIFVSLESFFRSHTFPSLTGVAASSCLLLLLVPMWRHPLRKRLFRWAFSPAVVAARAGVL